MACFLLIAASGCNNSSDPSPDTRRVLLRLTSNDLAGMDAQYASYRQKLNEGEQLQGTGLATDNKQIILDDLRQQVGEVSRIVIAFGAVKASNSVRPGPSTRYVAEILVDGAVKSRAVIDSTTPINANGNLFAIAEAEIR